MQSEFASPSSETAPARRALYVGVGLASPLWPAFALAAGAGMAAWWWLQLSRGSVLAPMGRSHLEAGRGSPHPEPPRPTDVDEGRAVAEGAAHPQDVMAHTVVPPEAPDAVAHPLDDSLPVSAAEVMAHTPPETAGVRLAKDGAAVPANDGPAADAAPPAGAPRPAGITPEITPEITPVLDTSAKATADAALGVQGEPRRISRRVISSVEHSAAAAEPTRVSAPASPAVSPQLGDAALAPSAAAAAESASKPAPRKPAAPKSPPKA